MTTFPEIVASLNHTEWGFFGSYVARLNCGNWPWWLVAGLVISDLVFFAAYMSIPNSIANIARERKFDRMGIFLARWFIGLCGLSHLISAGMFIVGWYPVSFLVKVPGAVVSIWAAVYFRKFTLLEGARLQALRKSLDEVHYSSVTTHDTRKAIRDTREKALELLDG